MHRQIDTYALNQIEPKLITKKKRYFHRSELCIIEGNKMPTVPATTRNSMKMTFVGDGKCYVHRNRMCTCLC